MDVACLACNMVHTQLNTRASVVYVLYCTLSGLYNINILYYSVTMAFQAPVSLGWDC